MNKSAEEFLKNKYYKEGGKMVILPTYDWDTLCALLNEYKLTLLSKQVTDEEIRSLLREKISMEITGQPYNDAVEKSIIHKMVEMYMKDYQYVRDLLTK